MEIERKRILIAASAWWPAPARLAIAFARGGMHVSAISPRGDPLRHVSSVQDHYSYSFYHPLRSFIRAIRTARPDIILPCDDRAARHVQMLYALGDDDLRMAIRYSLGDPASFDTLRSRHATLEVAQSLGIRVPPMRLLDRADALARWDQPLPWVLKSSGSWGGNGVRIVHDVAEALAAQQELGSPLDAVRAVKRWLVNRDGFWLEPWLRRRVPEVIAQGFIAGRPANIAVACWRGEVIGSLAVAALQTQGPTGAATIARVIDCPEMLKAAQLIAESLQLSGMHGLDFMLDAENRPWLIEVNPRATQLCHFAREGGSSIAASLVAVLRGGSPRPEPAAPAGSLIALFPRAWYDQPHNPLLQTPAHDVPWEEPALVQELMRPPWPNRSRLARLWQTRVRPRDDIAWQGGRLSHYSGEAAGQEPAQLGA